MAPFPGCQVSKPMECPGQYAVHWSPDFSVQGWQGHCQAPVPNPRMQGLGRGSAGCQEPNPDAKRGGARHPGPNSSTQGWEGTISGPRAQFGPQTSLTPFWPAGPKGSVPLVYSILNVYIK